jgi:hypothetical protein
MKFRLIDIYNQKLSERIRRKEFVINRKLLDLKEQMRLDKARTKEEKEIYNMMKVSSVRRRSSPGLAPLRIMRNLFRESSRRNRSGRGWRSSRNSREKGSELWLRRMTSWRARRRRRRRPRRRKIPTASTTR